MSLIRKIIILRCSDYGHDCSYEIQGRIEFTITEFCKHTIDVHGIEYGIDVIGSFVRRKYPEIKIL